MRGLGKRLEGITSKSEKRKTIQQYLRDCEEDKAYFANLYPIFTQALENTGNVTKAINELVRSGYILIEQTNQFSKHYQISCVAARKPLKTPTEHIEKTKTKTPSKKTKNNNTR